MHARGPDNNAKTSRHSQVSLLSIQKFVQTILLPSPRRPAPRPPRPAPQRGRRRPRRPAPPGPPPRGAKAPAPRRGRGRRSLATSAVAGGRRRRPSSPVVAGLDPRTAPGCPAFALATEGDDLGRGIRRRGRRPRQPLLRPPRRPPLAPAAPGGQHLGRGGHGLGRRRRNARPPRPPASRPPARPRSASRLTSLPPSPKIRAWPQHLYCCSHSHEPAAAAAA